MRNESEPVGIGDEGAVHTDDAQVNCVTGRGPVSDPDLPKLVAGLDDE